MLRRLLENHVLTSLILALVVVLGAVAYNTLPREQDPTVNLNYIDIATVFPGASAEDVEERITEILEEAVSRVADVRAVSSVSRLGSSSIGVRFEDLSKNEFEERLTDLRREVQASTELLPREATQPVVTKVTSANNMPSIMLVLTADKTDVALVRTARRLEDELEKMRGVERVDAEGDRDLELQVKFDPAAMVGLSLAPVALADTIATYFRNVAAGTLDIGKTEWLVRLVGTSADPGYLAELPILTARGEVPLRSVAQVEPGLADATELARYEGQPAIVLNVYKQGEANILALVERVNAYVEQFNRFPPSAGTRLVMLNDQTAQTEQAIGVMESNAIVGLLLVLGVTALFLGRRLAILTSAGIVFSLTGTFLVLWISGLTLNVIVLLGLVIALGMLVDDAVVVVEAIHRRLQRGTGASDAVIAALREVAAPVSASVLTTVAAFLPLTLLPGVLGDYMRVIPVVVISALLLSLIESFWLLPSHALSFGEPTGKESSMEARRRRLTQTIRNGYTHWLVLALRRPRATGAIAGGVLAIALIGLALGAVRIDYFASDPARTFYVGLITPAGTTLERTLAATQEMERRIRAELTEEELRDTVSYTGTQFNADARPRGAHLGQVAVALNAATTEMRSVPELIDALRPQLQTLPDVVDVSFLQVTNGPPVSTPINVKVRGDDPLQIRAAADRARAILEAMPGVRDITDDDVLGGMELRLRLNPDAITRAGLNPADVIRSIRLLTDGEVVAAMQEQGEPLEVRVRVQQRQAQQIDDYLRQSIALPDGSAVSLANLVTVETMPVAREIRHYNLQRAITLSGEIEDSETDTVTVNRRLQARWEAEQARFYPSVTLDFTGELDEIEESLDSIGLFFLIGLGLIFLILGTQFRSYVQPVIVLITVPLAFAGVVIGLMISRTPLSLYTLYGVVALAGISVNTAIVLMSAANERLRQGMSVRRAIVYAARRRVIPILITSGTTIAGLLSLAFGLAGDSPVWGSVASAIIWGLAVSTLLSLFVVPLLYTLVARPLAGADREIMAPPALEDDPHPLAKLQRLLRPPLPLTARERNALLTIRHDPALQGLYRDARAELVAGHAWEALKLFEQAHALQIENTVIRLGMAGALVALMDQSEYDEGFATRAERLLNQVRRDDPANTLVQVLTRALVGLRVRDDE